MATSMQLSKATRDRLRQVGRPGATLEETVVEALDALEREQFWAEAEAWKARRDAMSPEELSRIKAAEADLARWADAR